MDFGLWKAAMPLWRVTSKWWRFEYVFMRGIMAVESLPACVAATATPTFFGSQEESVSR
jgi:hypothetical protein